MWIVEKDGIVAGRICAIINPRYNDLYSCKRVRFGWFDTIDDPEVAGLLIRSAAEWGADNGMTEIHGPLYYNTLGKQGMLVEGFGNIPPFNCIYNFPYYKDLIEGLGFHKECDWLQYRIGLPVDSLPAKTSRLATIVSERYRLKEISLDIIKKKPEMVKGFFDMYSDSFSGIVYNFIPFTEEEKQEEADSVMQFINDRYSCVLEDESGDLAAFGIIFPSISKALQKAGGHLFPFGWIHLLSALRSSTTLDLMIMGAVGKWQGKGISSLLFHKVFNKPSISKAKEAITNPQIETNSAVNLWKEYGAEPFMRRRCYLADISAVTGHKN